MDRPPLLPPEQPSLFSPEQLRQVHRPIVLEEPSVEMSLPALVAWKQAIATFQRKVNIAPAIAQGNLFGIAPAEQLGAEPVASSDASVDTLVDPETIDPFGLPLQNTEFWRWTAADVGVAALYFVIDQDGPVLLYVGETVKSNQRWKGLHDCKRYLMNYRQLHNRHQLPSVVNIAFWRNAPTATRARQQLEAALIYKWRSPFNKENWTFWGTPFVGGKLS